MIHLKKEVFILDFVNKPTIETAKSLLGVKISYQDQTQTYSGYIVETEAYLGFKDKAAHGFGGKQTHFFISTWWNHIWPCYAYAFTY